MGRGGYHSNRAEFLSDEAILKYSRNGGCFVTTKKAIAFVVFALVSLLIVILVMYYYGPNKTTEKVSLNLSYFKEYSGIKIIKYAWSILRFNFKI